MGKTEKVSAEKEEEEMGTSSNNEFDLPEEVLQALPSDPFAQLDVARKITSIALSTRVSALESEASALRSELSDKDDFISDLQSQIESLDASLSETTHRLSRADQEKVASSILLRILIINYYQLLLLL